MKSLKASSKSSSLLVKKYCKGKPSFVSCAGEHERALYYLLELDLWHPAFGLRDARQEVCPESEGTGCEASRGAFGRESFQGEALLVLAMFEEKKSLQTTPFAFLSLRGSFFVVTAASAQFFEWNPPEVHLSFFSFEGISFCSALAWISPGCRKNKLNTDYQKNKWIKEGLTLIGAE